jgi:hypothetical protein
MFHVWALGIARLIELRGAKTVWRSMFFEFCNVCLQERHPNPLSRSGLHSAHRLEIKLARAE